MSLRSLRPRKPALAVAAALTLALVGTILVTGPDLGAQEGDGAIVVGTYQPQEVAQAVGFQQQVMQQMQGLQQRAQEAQQAGDQQALQQIQVEAQQIQQDATAKLVADIEAVMPQVAGEIGASVIAADVTYTAEGVTTQDVTQAVIDALGAAETEGEMSGEGEMSEGSGE